MQAATPGRGLVAEDACGAIQFFPAAEVIRALSMAAEALSCKGSWRWACRASAASASHPLTSFCAGAALEARERELAAAWGRSEALEEQLARAEAERAELANSLRRAEHALQQVAAWLHAHSMTIVQAHLLLHYWSLQYLLRGHCGRALRALFRVNQAVPFCACHACAHVHWIAQLAALCSLAAM